MNTLKVFVAALLLITGTYTAHAQTLEPDYLKTLGTSFTDPALTNWGSELFWSLCLGEKQELSKEELNKRYTALATDNVARIAFYKRFNYYLSGKVTHYTDMLTLYDRTDRTQNTRPFTYTQIKEMAGIINSYGQDSVLLALWDSPTANPNEQVYMIVEQMPEYPGGEVEFLKFLQKHINYPRLERDNDIQGKVLLRFKVKADGSVSTLTLVRALSPGLDNEAIRVVKMLPNLKPGRQQGKPVPVWYNLPVQYKLQ